MDTKLSNCDKHISMRVTETMRAKLKEIAQDKGMHYQKLIKIWFAEKIEQYTKQKKDEALRKERESQGLF